MTFPATDCEKNVLAQLGFGAAMPLPFEIAQYIHAACYAGLPGDGIATRALRLLAWPKALKLIAEAFPLAKLQDVELAQIRDAYLAGGSGEKKNSCWRWLTCCSGCHAIKRMLSASAPARMNVASKGASHGKSL